ncbi:hypothetical protein PUN28_004767 [Cardiocondyla obscurior]|uniref:Uncharacterized protein n=1 Tax=Cardiocondyla obscurior TaxID=286306 RepID=A0AAW2GHK8_9HYME
MYLSKNILGYYDLVSSSGFSTRRISQCTRTPWCEGSRHGVPCTTNNFALYVTNNAIGQRDLAPRIRVLYPESTAAYSNAVVEP